MLIAGGGWASHCPWASLLRRQVQNSVVPKGNLLDWVCHPFVA